MIKLDLKTIEKAPEDWNEVFDYREDLEKLKPALEKFKNKKRIILIGNGGSITSYDAYLAALGSPVKSQTVWTMEPDMLHEIKKEFKKEETIVIPVSKSGKTLGLLEALLYFIDYDVLAVTDPNSGVLCEIAKKMGWDILEHPPIGGRFSGGTSSAFVPAILAKLDVDEIKQGLIDGYELKDEAYSLSKYYFDLEKEGYSEVYVPIYSNRLRSFQNLIVQLMHESVCKDGAGQTFYSFLGPEAQHHTNQRFLGGKKSVIGTFITVKNPEYNEKIEVPKSIAEIDYKGSPMSVVDGLPYQEALLAEYIGTKNDADAKSVPNVTIELEEISPRSVGVLVSFWHLVAFYSSILRNVNPFDQPAVEDSKNITLEVIKRFEKK